MFFIVAGVVVFSLFGGAFGGGNIGKVVVWGTMDDATFNYLLDSLKSQDSSLSSVTYVQKDPSSYDTELLNAMAAGTGPDLFLVSQDELGEFDDKVLVVPYATMSQATYLASFIDEGQVFLTSQGTMALPFSIDPLVMYWNSDLFAASGQAQPPQFWDDLLTLAPELTALDNSQNVTKSAVALGTWANVTDAKPILSALFMQAGENLTQWGPSGQLTSVFGETPPGAAAAPAESALRFYTEFANPSKTTYSWNNSLPNSQDAFVGGQLAIYFGFASEYQGLLQRNPNLHISVALLPQLTGNATHLTYGNLEGLAISRTSANPQGAMAVALKLTTQEASGIVSSQTGLPSARRDVPLNTSANAAAQVFAQSALISRGWVDPAPAQTDTLFETMIQSVLSGSEQPTQAVSDAAAGFAALLPTQ